MDLGDLAASLILRPRLGQKRATAILIPVTTTSVLCSPRHFNPRVAPRAKGVGAELQTPGEGEPPIPSTQQQLPYL